ncbi:MAG: alpha/beta fold hydrolase [Pseudomonadota bacterium]
MAVLNGATGVPARFYGTFADWLAGQGVACLTYDYRDFGWSGSPRNSPATMTDWGVRDQQAARDHVAAAVPGVPLWVIGHSLGGMMLPFQTGLDRIDRVICVAAGAVHVSDHPWPYQALARAFWAPGLVTLSRRLGRLPAKALGVGHDIPAGVYAQWRLWCLSRAFHGADPDLGVARPDGLACPMRVVAVSDDDLCPPKSVWRLMRAYPAAYKSQMVIRPDAVGLARIGHLDVLGAKGAPCWPRIMAPTPGNHVGRSG